MIYRLAYTDVYGKMDLCKSLALHLIPSLVQFKLYSTVLRVSMLHISSIAF